jgi:hypothetical protein
VAGFELARRSVWLTAAACCLQLGVTLPERGAPWLELAVRRTLARGAPANAFAADETASLEALEHVLLEQHRTDQIFSFPRGGAA